MEEHTPAPGPYVVSHRDVCGPENGSTYMRIVISNGEVWECQCEGWSKERQNTAELMASAPKLRADRDALLDALNKIIEMNRQTAKDKYGDPDKAESWSCVTVARAAIAQAEKEG